MIAEQTVVRNPVSALILDVDGTLIDSWNHWADITREALDELTQIHGIDVSQVLDEITQISNSQRFNDIASYLTLPCFSQKPDMPADEYEQKVARITKKWAEQKVSCDLFDGLLDVMKQAKSKGAKVVIYTDRPWPAVVMSMVGAGVEPSLIDLMVGQQACANDVRASVQGLTKRELAYVEKIRDRMLVLDKNELQLTPAQHAHIAQGNMYKPCPLAMKLILDRIGVDEEECLMVGDHINDGLTTCLKGWRHVGAVPEHDGGNIPFAWAKYGTIIHPENEIYTQKAISDTDYVLGAEAIGKAFKDLGFTPDYILEKPSDLSKMFYFLPPKGKPAPRAARSRKPVFA